MKSKIYLFVLLLGFSMSSMFAQTSTKLESALKYIQSHAKDFELLESDYEKLQLSSEVYSQKSGVTFIYLNQTYNDIVIRNAMATVSIDKNGKVVYFANNFEKNIEKRIKTTKPTVAIESAITAAAGHLGVAYTSKPNSEGRNDQNKMTFSWPEVVKSDITTQLMFDVKGDELILVWNMNMDMAKNADYWDMNIDATNGNFASKLNLTVYCNHSKDAFAHHDHCQIKTFKTIQKNSVSTEQALSNNTAARYNVYAIPVESPNHGDRSIVNDDQYPVASPYGWHDVNGVAGPEFTITRGNNVYAYQDKNNDDSSDGPDTDGGAELNFDFPMDLNIDPRDNADATVTNLFYMVNMMHDVAQVLGFDEAAGNFQQRNYTGAPGAGDYVLAQAFDGANLPTPNLNNANFSTPSDGGNGRMQMYLWTNSGGAISVDEPENIAGFISEYGTGNFGAAIPGQNDAPITATVVVGRDNSPANPTAGCGTLVNTTETLGKIVMLDRGLCEFGRKVLNGQRAGAIAVIICNVAGVDNGTGDEIINMAAGAIGDQVNIPSIFMKKSDCDRIKFSIANGVPVTMTFKVRNRVGAEFLDGSLDNGIIAHEFGHGISNRLTGGRIAAGCLGNDEQMGEGWSDFFSLIMTHRPGDKASDARGIGTYADGQATTGRGIRTFPYSTDMSVNPQTFDDIKGTSAPHPLGAVWAAMLWDMYWKFVDLYGFDPDWTNEESGNYKGAFLVMEGMKFQPCSPGFIEGRDAILAADAVIYDGIHNCMIWEVFARRGLGINASGGSTGDRNDGTQGFEPLPTCLEELKITKTVTPLLAAGEEILVEIRAINHLPLRQTNVVISDELEQGLTYVDGSSSIVPTIVGNTLNFVIGDMEFDTPILLSYRVRTSTQNKSQTLFLDNFEGELDWDIVTEDGTSSWLPDYDLFRSPETSFSIENPPVDLDASLISTSYSIMGNNAAMRFWHRFNTQPGVDGGFVEISVDGGIFTLIPADKFIRNGYNSSIAYGTLAIPALRGWTGSSNGVWIDSYIDLREYVGKSVRFKFRFGANETTAPSTPNPGWYIDDFELMDLFKYQTRACITSDGSDPICTDVMETIINSDGMVNATDERFDHFQLQIFPNPAQDYIIMRAISPIAQDVNVSITSIDGRSIINTPVKLQSQANQWVVDTHTLKSGMYFVTIQSGIQSSVQKLIIR